MGLQADFQKAARNIVTAFGDIPKTVTYYKKGTLIFNPATGISSETGGASYSGVQAVFASYMINQIDGQHILIGDKKVLIPSLNLSVTPVPGDYITDTDSKKWQIINVQTDPAIALWTLHVRQG